jgi:hypothetical protein
MTAKMTFSAHSDDSDYHHPKIKTQKILKNKKKQQQSSKIIKKPKQLSKSHRKSLKNLIKTEKKTFRQH